MIAQLNPTVGDLAGNIQKICDICLSAASKNVDMVAFPEMFLTGYQVHDLLLKKAFIIDVRNKMENIAKSISPQIGVLIGAPVQEGEKIYNAYHLFKDGTHRIVSRKHHLPNTDVFDEKRVFSAAPLSEAYSFQDIRVGSPICEDFWYKDVANRMLQTGAEVFIAPNGSPYSRGKVTTRENIMKMRSTENQIPIVYLNLVGAQDDIVFDGGSFVMNPGGKMVVRLPQFEECVRIVKFSRLKEGWTAETGEIDPPMTSIAQDYRAMVQSIKDYIKKSGFSKVILGLSGGIDSALVAVLAVDALGQENVCCVRLPSEFSSRGSLDDAADLIERIGCHHETIPISKLNDELKQTLSPVFKGTTIGVTEENIQSRLRGLILMALSNKFNMMLLTTGNKSEVAVGYSTIYGDMAGGYNPIKDLYKTQVFETCWWRNTNYENWMLGAKGEIIPKAIIEKPPSAELRPNQRDDDSLPPYDILDEILTGLIDEDLSVKDLINRGYDDQIVKKVEDLIYKSEYKRYQAAPGTHLTERSFWLSRRYPIVQKWRDK